MATRFCMYCRCEKPSLGFRDIVDPRHRTKRGQCSDCQKTRKLPRTTLEEMARREREARRQQDRIAAIEAAERRKKDGRQNPRDQ